MKFVGVIALCLLVGCTARPTLEELETEALDTGDWAAVEKRERMNKRMNVVQSESACRGDKVEICQTRSAQEVCDCVSPHDLRPR